MNLPPAPQRTHNVAVAWLLYLTFVVYGSLVPLELRPLTWEQAWIKFQRIPFLNLGVESRADWVANGVLYAPLGFLTAWLLTTARSQALRVLGLMASIAFGIVLAVVVEFTQLFFAPRTVSLNDLLAEGLGTVLGALLAFFARDRLARAFEEILRRAPRSAGTAIALYAAGWLAFSFFPYDLLLSPGEIARKAAGDLWGWLFAPAGAAQPLRSVVRTLAEVLMVIPLAWWWAGGRRASPSTSLFSAAVVGFALGAFVEIGQFFIASGTSQGASVVARAAGFALGALLARDLGHWSLARWRAYASSVAGFFTLLYLVFAPLAMGWASGAWRSPQQALGRLAAGEVRFLPFYYHYYTTEAAALLSLASVAFIYAPVGVLAWVRGAGRFGAAALAAGFSALVEFGRLFPQGVKPDPTNVLIAAGSAWAVVVLLEFLTHRPVQAGAAGRRGF